MPPTRPYSETARKLVHMAFGAGALLLAYLPWWQAVGLAAVALLFNVLLLRGVTGGRLHRPVEHSVAFPPGLVLYPASILILLLVFPRRPDIVAASWGVLAFGDGAATLAGRFGRLKWPWNPQKSVLGSTAFVAAGSIAGSFLAWWCAPAVHGAPGLWFWLAAPFVASVAAAAAETVPIRLDDNVTVPFTAAAMLWAASLVERDLLLAALPAAGAALLWAAPVNAAASAAGYLTGTVSRSGALAGACIGTMVQVCAGWGGWILLLSAFGAAAVSSQAGLSRKLALGIAEPRGRSAGQALANTGIATAAAALSLAVPNRRRALVAFAAALTAGASDTAASEIGKAWGRRTWSLNPPGAVPPGTSGAMSVEGTLAGIATAALLAWVAVIADVVPGHAVLPVVTGATAGSLVESLLSSTFEARGLLNNDALNLLNTAVAAWVAVLLT